ncbi:MAG: cation-translocating P-type ATPase [Ruminococcaceae bacterium]|nr:cation-translocating P-type ATPase [Oscillospiraceae bacterium]
MTKPFSATVEQVAQEIDTDLVKGLTSNEASLRYAKNGPNSLGEEKKVPLWKRFLQQFADAMVIILIAAAALSGYMAFKSGGGIEEWIDVFVILAIVILNAVLGVYQEGKADQALAALKKMSSPQTKVIRDGKLVMVDSENVVVGDVISIDAGDSISADLRLIESSSLKAEEASLTGESVAVEKDATAVLPEDCALGDRKNMLYMGTAVTYGRAKGVVVATARDTELGKIATKLTNIEDEDTPLQASLNKLGKILAVVCIVVCLIVLLVDIFVQKQPWEDALMTAVSLAVAAIPEGLAAVVTIVLSIGMTKMAENNAIVKRLLAVETLGCVDVICSDKTGTLTQNQMTVKVIYDGNKKYNVEGGGYAPQGNVVDEGGKPVKIEGVLRTLILSSVLCNDAAIVKQSDTDYSCIGDPTEGSLTTLGMKVRMFREETMHKYPRETELPFDSDRKMMTTYHSGVEEGKWISFTKGAPDIVISRCSSIMTANGVEKMSDEKRAEIREVNHNYAIQAIRVLAFAMKEHGEGSKESFTDEENMTFIGLIGMIDPARTEAKDAIAVCKEAGIRAVMITGDFKDSAVAIADNLEMRDEKHMDAYSGEELDKISDDELLEVVEKTSVYARVSPEHKVRIVNALKKNGHIASMTGDGVNDAMALKTADIGVAMGITGTDVSKNSADMILMDDNFATIVKAVEQGRTIYSNIRKFVGFLLSCNVGEILVIFLLSLVPKSLVPGIAAPLTAIQLLWLNLITDSFPALALGREKAEPGIMKMPPRSKKEPIINKSMMGHIAMQSVGLFISVAAAFIIALMSMNNGGTFFYSGVLADAAAKGVHPLDVARTVAFATLICAELFRAFAARSERISVFKLGLFSNKMMNIAVALSLVMLVAVIYIPGLNGIFNNVALNPLAWVVILPLAILPFAVSEISKLIKGGCNK